MKTTVAVLIVLMRGLGAILALPIGIIAIVLLLPIELWLRFADSVKEVKESRYGGQRYNEF